MIKSWFSIREKKKKDGSLLVKLFQELILIFNTIDVERIEVKKILLGNDILNSKLRIISFIFYSTLFLNYIFLVFYIY